MLTFGIRWVHLTRGANSALWEPYDIENFLYTEIIASYLSRYLFLQFIYAKCPNHSDYTVSILP